MKTKFKGMLFSIFSTIAFTSCGKAPDHAKTKIIGGALAKNGDFKSFASIYNKNLEKNDCGAVFIDHKYLLASSACLGPRLGKEHTIRVQSSEENFIEFPIEFMVKQRENYESENPDYFVLLKLEEYDGWKKRFIEPISIDTEIDDLSTEATWTTVGSGSISTDGLYYDQFVRTLDVERLATEKCDDSSVPFKDFICAKSLKSGYKQTQQGSALYSFKNGKYQLAGIYDDRDAYIKIAPFIAWINATKSLLDTPTELNEQTFNRFIAFSKCGELGTNEHRYSEHTDSYLTVKDSFSVRDFKLMETKAINLNLQNSLCTFKIPGNETIEIYRESNENTVVAKSAAGYWKMAAPPFVIKISEMSCKTANMKVKYLYHLAEEGLEVGIQDRTWITNLSDTVVTIPKLRNEVKSVCEFENNKLTLISGIAEDRTTVGYAVLESGVFGDYNNKTFKMRPGRFSYGGPFYHSGVLKYSSLNAGEMKIYRHINSDLYTWVLDCNQPLTLTDGYGVKYVSIYQNAKKGIFKHQIMFNHAVNSHGFFQKDTIKSFGFALSDSDESIPLQCEFNQRPMSLISL